MTETIQRNNTALWLGFFALLLAVGSIGLFFVSTPFQPALPWLSPLLALAAVIVTVVGLRRAQSEPGIYSGKAAGWTLTTITSLVLLLGIFFFYSARHIPAANSAPQVGQKAPEFTLPDTNGQSVSLGQLLAANQPPPKAVLVVFYRGYW
ncbi:MAG TPA: hypothetical protein VE783_13740 [Candidatus Limnocylindrales bacterium]|nr:hypothetical protein [Candidatus Limnocylindrales bacterium]